MYLKKINKSTFMCKSLNHIQRRLKAPLHSQKKNEMKNLWSEHDATVAGKYSQWEETLSRARL